MTIQNKSKPDIKAVVREATDAILNLHAHLAYLRAFDDELRSVMRGKPTMIVNGIFWSAMLHSRDAFIIHFASWAKHAYDDSDGLFARLWTRASVCH